MLNYCSLCFFFNDTATTEIYTLSLHDALPILAACRSSPAGRAAACSSAASTAGSHSCEMLNDPAQEKRSEEHTSELQSRQYLVCRLLLEKKKKIQTEPS